MPHNNGHIAKVAIPLPIDTLFDYLIPQALRSTLAIGMRVEVLFNRKRMIGYVVDRVKHSSFPRLNPIISIVDSFPIISLSMITLAQEMQKYYVCSFGEALHATVTNFLKTNRGIAFDMMQNQAKTVRKPVWRFAYDYADGKIWDLYKDQIVQRVARKKKVILLFPEKRIIEEALTRFASLNKVNVGTWHGDLKKSQALDCLQSISRDELDVLIGTRSAAFIPMANLDLIIVHDEENYAHRDDQVPYYHAGVISRMRSRIEGCDLLLTAVLPSLSTYYESTHSKNMLIDDYKKERVAPPAFRIEKAQFADKVNFIIEKEITEALSQKQKILIVQNRKGFASQLYCKKCKKTIECSRCNVSLRYNYEAKTLECPLCNALTKPLELCPHCNASYIRYSGLGIEKLASNLSRIFPTSSIALLDETLSITTGKEQPDIILSTKKIEYFSELRFDIAIMWDLESFLNVHNFRSFEEIFKFLWKLMLQTSKKLFVCTHLKDDFNLFTQLRSLDYRSFYNHELGTRKELHLPPEFSNVKIIVRGPDKEKVAKAAQELSEKITASVKTGASISLPYESAHSKKREKYYSYLLFKAKNLSRYAAMIKDLIKEVRKNKIIITVERDPLE